jgi:hypothetical protein
MGTRMMPSKATKVAHVKAIVNCERCSAVAYIASRLIVITKAMKTRRQPAMTTVGQKQPIQNT